VPAARRICATSARTCSSATYRPPDARSLAAGGWRLAANGPIALRLAKESTNRVEFLPLKDGYRTEQDYTNRLLTHTDRAEARAAYLEKREPVWHWR
jgi:enoyl-CoA hydratase/carnithine racemase